jgi:quercetin dioxygenase-like cupin family protein
MKLVRKGEKPEVQATSDLFVGTVHSRPMIERNESQNLTVSEVRFTAGARNRFHTHTADQVLYITSGQGIVASKEAENPVSAGDIVHVTAGEVHWHGAAPGQDMAHLSILPPCTTVLAED